ncbi:hypothetical protein B0I37DRAFT_377465 [Chaetomium sp. MPI-CAGE-AT-0009]|nr:hypothetical protein B0I37DRAFT_377465 [Chaetomium sp. MPI-CAGE-AT-0009]
MHPFEPEQRARSSRLTGPLPPIILTPRVACRSRAAWGSEFAAFGHGPTSLPSVAIVGGSPDKTASGHPGSQGEPGATLATAANVESDQQERPGRVFRELATGERGSVVTRTMAKISCLGAIEPGGRDPPKYARIRAVLHQKNHSPRAVDPFVPTYAKKTLPSATFSMLPAAICSAALAQEEFQFHSFPLAVRSGAAWARFAAILGHLQSCPSEPIRYSARWVVCLFTGVQPEARRASKTGVLVTVAQKESPIPSIPSPR